MVHKILIVDDDSQQRRYLSAILSSLGYATTTASGGIAAVERLGTARQHGISLALLDLHMPDLDGIKVLEQVRAGGAGLPILVLTSDGSVARTVDAMRAGASDFIVKPVAPERLDVSIRNALALSNLSSEVKRLTNQAEHRLSFEDLVAISPAT